VTACASTTKGPAPLSVPTPPATTIVAASGGDQVPALQTSPLITWGPLPPGQEYPLPPRTIDLQHQVIRVQFDWTRKAVVGSTTLRFAALNQPVSSVQLDAVGMTIKGVQRGGTTLKHEYDGETLTVTLSAPLASNDTSSFTIDYETVPKKGAYFIDRKKVMWTQGEMIETRHWVPTVDRPDDKTTWEIFVAVPRNEKALSNGRLVGVRPVNDSIHEWHWSQEKPASTYLFSIVTGDYTVIKEEWDGIPISYWTYPDSVEAAKRGFKGTPDMMAVYSRLTGVRYPWAKYDQSAVPDFIFGGMENVSATTQNDKTVLIAAWDSLRDAQALVAHELAHQWFGNIVTLTDWPHAWLNEGFATFLETVYWENSGQEDRAALNRVNDQQAAIAADRKARRPLVYGRWANNPLELFISGHIYPKGAAVLDMLRATVGEQMFWKAVNAYLTTYAFKNVVSEDLRTVFEKTTGMDLKPFFDQWVYGAGFPAFQVEHHYDAAQKTLTLTATQVQPRDSLTGLFTMDVEVAVMTDKGIVRSVAPVRGEKTTITIPLNEAPRAIRWDASDRWLDVIDFPRSTNMLLYQLQYGDVLARAEAIALLKGRLPDAGVQTALQRTADTDPARELRNRAREVLRGATTQ
jgi:aminopeptidase N